MKRMTGIGASKGIAIGKLSLCVIVEDNVARRDITDVDFELARLDAARKTAIEALGGIYRNALSRIGQEDSMIIQIHITMLQDEDFFSAIQNIIMEEKVNAEYAVWKSGKQFSEMFAQMDDEYMRGRDADVIDISKRLIRNLNESYEDDLNYINKRTIVGAADLMPSETVQMDPNLILAFITREGSKSSHSAILARTMGIPAVVGLAGGFSELADGAMTIVDGMAGEVILEPDHKTMQEYRKKQVEFEKNRKELKLLKKSKAITKNGVEIEICANIGHVTDVDMALENDADGIGLFRSEFLYMENNSFPSEEQQFRAYKDVLQKMDGRRVIVRTLDLGADKQVSYFNIPEEENPAMGYRAIRICLDHREIFMTQIRALLRASVFGKLAILFPMITSLEEIRRIKSMVNEVKEDLTEENILFDSNIELGIMIETPAAVMLSDLLAKEVDFFSIGTNDLTQFTLAVDRTNHTISKMFDCRHPAVLRMIQVAVENAKKAGIWVGICGESAADTALTEFYVKIGVNELSVAPSSVLELRKAVREIDL